LSGYLSNHIAVSLKTALVFVSYVTTPDFSGVALFVVYAKAAISTVAMKMEPKP